MSPILRVYLKDINELISELSMVKCTDEVRELAGDQHEPYRAILKQLRTLLGDTLESLDAQMKGELAPNKFCNFTNFKPM